jgi:hypothetical protein
MRQGYEDLGPSVVVHPSQIVHGAGQQPAGQRLPTVPGVLRDEQSASPEHVNPGAAVRASGVPRLCSSTRAHTTMIHNRLLAGCSFNQ